VARKYKIDAFCTNCGAKLAVVTKQAKLLTSYGDELKTKKKKITSNQVTNISCSLQTK